MHTNPDAPKNMDEYIAGFPSDVQAILQKVRATIRKAAPDAQEVISYLMPAFKQHGNLVYFAAFKKHIGLFPPVSDEKLKQEAAVFAGPKGNLRFSLDEPMPYALIGRIVKARVKEDIAQEKYMKATTTTLNSAKEVDEYLATVPAAAQTALEKLRKAIRAAAPAATEALSYDRPAFLLNGTRLVQYWASKEHCSLYVMTPAFVKAHAEDLKGYDATGATIRFLTNKPLPAALVKKLIKARVAEHEARAKKTKPAK